MRLVVTDANIIIDLAAGGLLEEMFRLPGVEFCVPVTLYVEELADYYGVLPALGLNVMTQSDEDVAYVEILSARFRAGINDLFALALARSLKCALLSGDQALRAAAEAERVEIHGTLWLIERLLDVGLVSVERVTTAYDAMRQDGSRLPWADVQLQIRRWRNVNR
jgi:predicted nucleic acid-binding protein